MSKDYQERRFYGSFVSVQPDIVDYLRTEKPKSLSFWRTNDMEVMIALLDFNPPAGVGTVVRVFRRFVEEPTKLYYWQQVEAGARYENEYETDLMKTIRKEKK